jgi:non-heme chloroperoxidase
VGSHLTCFAAAHKTAKLVKDATVKVYPGAPHGLYGDYAAEFNQDLVDFLRS